MKTKLNVTSQMSDTYPHHTPASLLSISDRAFTVILIPSIKIKYTKTKLLYPAADAKANTSINGGYEANQPFFSF